MKTRRSFIRSLIAAVALAPAICGFSSRNEIEFYGEWKLVRGSAEGVMRPDDYAGGPKTWVKLEDGFFSCPIEGNPQRGRYGFVIK